MPLGEGGRVKPDELTAGDILLSLKEDTRVSAADERGRGLERTLASCKEKDCRLRHTAPSSGQRRPQPCTRHPTTLRVRSFPQKDGVPQKSRDRMAVVVV